MALPPPAVQAAVTTVQHPHGVGVTSRGIPFLEPVRPGGLDEEALSDVSSLFSNYDPCLAVSSSHLTRSFLAFSAIFGGVFDTEENEEDRVMPRELRAHVWLYLRAGELRTWGSSRHGVLAQGDENNRFVPVKAPFPRSVLSVAAGNDHMLIQCLDGVYAVGRSAYGQLGIDVTEDLRIPERIRALDHTLVEQIACGYWHSLFLTQDGIYVCGWNNHGQLGIGEMVRHQRAPVMLHIPNKGKATSIAGGAFHSLFLVGGSVYVCGVGSSGELGLGSRADHSTPVLHPFFKNKHVVSVSAGGHRSFVHCLDGLYAFGDNYCGTLGVGDENPRLDPVLIPTFTEHARKVCCVSSRGGRTSVVVKGVGLFSFGAGDNGKLGLGDNVNRSEPVLVPALSGGDAMMTACGYDHAITICQRRVLACGSNAYGELGTGLPSPSEGEDAQQDGENEATVVMGGVPMAPLPPLPAAAVMGGGVAIPVTPVTPPTASPMETITMHASTPKAVEGLQYCDVLSCAAGDGFSAAVTVPGGAPIDVIYASRPYEVPLQEFESRTY